MFGCFLCSDTATIEIYTLSLHDALPISRSERERPTVEVSGVAAVGVLDPQLPDPLAVLGGGVDRVGHVEVGVVVTRDGARSEEHTSELQSRQYVACRLLLETKTTLVST